MEVRQRARQRSDRENDHEKNAGDHDQTIGWHGKQMGLPQYQKKLVLRPQAKLLGEQRMALVCQTWFLAHC